METGSLKILSIPAASLEQIKSFKTSIWLLKSALLGHGQCLSGLPLKAEPRCREDGTSQCGSISSSWEEQPGWSLERLGPLRVYKWACQVQWAELQRLENESRVRNGGQIMDCLLPIKPLSTSSILLGASRGAVSLLKGWLCVTVSFIFSDFLGNS